MLNSSIGIFAEKSFFLMYIKCGKCEFNNPATEQVCSYCGSEKSSALAETGDKFFSSVILSQNSLISRKDVLTAKIVPWIKPAIIGATGAFFLTLFASLFFSGEWTLFLIFFVSLFVIAEVFKELKDPKKEEKENSAQIPPSPEIKLFASAARRKKFKKAKNSDESKNLLEQEVPKWSLLGKKRTAQKRIDELRQRHTEINSIQRQFKNIDANSRSAKQKLYEAEKIVTSHIGRYKIQRQKIRLAVAQNKTLPFLDKISDLSEYEIVIALDRCKEVLSDLREIEKENPEISRIFNGENDELNDFEKQIKETKIIVKKLEESVLHRKAVFAIQGITSIENTFDAADFGDLAHRLETFGAKSTLVDFNESFDELEFEYKRLRAENEAGQKLLG